MFAIILSEMLKGKRRNLMITYELSLDRQNLLGADRFSVAAESNESIRFRFHFDRSWRVFDTKAAVFKDDGGHYYVLDITSDCVTVPWEVLRSTNGFELAVVAYEDEVVLTSKKVSIAVSSSLLPEDYRQLSPTETLFDRLKTQAQNEAELAYRSTIRNLNAEHSRQLTELGEQLAAERRNTEAVRTQKDAEIAALNYQATCVANQHSADLAALQAQLDEQSVKAGYWELVDTAIRNKTAATNALWTGGSEEFELPIMNLTSVTALTTSSISSNIRKATFNIPNVTSLYEVFTSRRKLREINLINTGNVTSLQNTFQNDSALKIASLDNLASCTQFNNAFRDCTSLETVTLGNTERITTCNSLFYNCYSLTNIIGTLNVTLCTVFTSTFSGCTNLENVRFTENSIRANIDFGYCVNLSKESIYSIVNALNAEYPATIYFSEHALSTSLTTAERAEITNTIRNTKGWTLSLS